MSQHPDCLVIGGGLIGMLTARELSRAGATVQLLERGDTGRESSWAGGGILSPLYPWRYPDAVTLLAQASQAVYPELIQAVEAESGISAEYLKSGLLIPDCDEIEAAQAWAKRFSVKTEITEPDEVIDIAPEISRGLCINKGIWLPKVAQVRNPRLAQALRVSLEQSGVEVITSCPVDHIETQSGRLSAVVTADGQSHAAGLVVVAGGAWSAGLLAPLGLDIPVQPVRGQMLLYKTLPGTVRRIILNRDRYVIPRQDGRVLVGSTLEHTGFEKQTTQAARTELEAEACRIVPALAEFPVETHWAGLRPGSPDGVPFIGACPGAEGVYINTGHYRNGVVLGAASAQLLAAIALGNESSLPIQAYSPEYLLGSQRAVV